MFKKAINLKPVMLFLDFWDVTMGHDFDDFDPEAIDLNRRRWAERCINFDIDPDPDEVLFQVTDVDHSKEQFRSLTYPIRLRRLYRLLHKRVRMRRFIRVRNHIRRRMIWALERLPWTSVPTGGTDAGPASVS